MTDSGYAIINSVLQPQEVAALATAVTQTEVTQTRTRAGARHLLTHPLVQPLAQDARLLHIAKQFLRHEPIPYRATLFDKSPQSNWLVAWHQDRSLPLVARHDVPGWGPWTVKAGGAIAMRPLLLHASSKARSDRPRRVLHIEYAESIEMGDGLKLAQA